MWQDLVEPAVLEIMSFLPFCNIVTAGQVCRRWHSLSLDDLLWRAILTQHFHLKPPVTLRSGAKSWRWEFIRMMDQVPSVVTDLPENYFQEARFATHVSFAHSGEMFSVCYRWHGVGIWSADHPCTRKAVIHNIGWNPTSSKFNSSDTLLLVTGFTGGGEGKVGVYQTGGAVYPDQFSLVKTVNADCAFPYNGWVTETAFLTAKLMDDMFMRVFLNSADPFEAELQCKSGSARTVIYDFLYNDVPLVPYPEDTPLIHFSSVRDGLPRVLFQLGKKELNVADPFNTMEDAPWNSAPTRMGLLGNYQFHEEQTYNTDEIEIFAPSDENFPHMLIAGFCPSPDHEMCYINARPLTRNVELENNSLYPLVFDSNENLQMFPLNLSTMTAGPPLVGHKGVAHTNVDWIQSDQLVPDVTNCYVGCGSEDGRGYLWDRHYGCIVSVLSGTLDVIPKLPTPPCVYRNETLSLLGLEESPPTVDKEYFGPKLEDFLKKKDEVSKEEDTSAQQEERNAAENEESLLTQDEDQSEIQYVDSITAEAEAIAAAYAGAQKQAAIDNEQLPILSVALDPACEETMIIIEKNGRIKVFRSKKWARENHFGKKNINSNYSSK